jgi:hypothetical protein
MEFEAVEPIHTASAALCYTGKDLVGRDASVVADPKGQRINELDASSLSFAGLHVGAEWKQRPRNQFHKARVTGQTREVRTLMSENFSELEVFESTVLGSVKQDQDGHHFTKC